MDDIWRLYHSDIVDNFLDSLYNHREREIQGIKLKNEGIELKTQKEIIPWNKVVIKDYYKYFAIYHQDNPAIHSRVTYNEFGTETLWSAIRTLLKEKHNNTSS